MVSILITHSAMYSTGHGIDIYRNYYWTTAFALTFLRLGIIVEICWRVLRQYRMAWTLARRVLAASIISLLGWTLYPAFRNVHHMKTFILVSQQRSDIMLAVVLLLVLGIGVYYRIHIPPLYWWVLIASCIYSASQVVGSEIGRHTAADYNSFSDFLQRFSIELMLSMWIWAIWRWGHIPTKSPSLISQGMYDDLSPQIHNRLHELNERLSDLRRRR